MSNIDVLVRAGPFILMAKFRHRELQGLGSRGTHSKRPALRFKDACMCDLSANIDSQNRLMGKPFKLSPAKPEIANKAQ